MPVRASVWVLGTIAVEGVVEDVVVGVVEDVVVGVVVDVVVGVVEDVVVGVVEDVVVGVVEDVVVGVVVDDVVVVDVPAGSVAMPEGLTVIASGDPTVVTSSKTLIASSKLWPGSTVATCCGFPVVRFLSVYVPFGLLVTWIWPPPPVPVTTSVMSVSRAVPTRGADSAMSLIEVALRPVARSRLSAVSGDKPPVSAISLLMISVAAATSIIVAGAPPMLRMPASPSVSAAC